RLGATGEGERSGFALAARASPLRLGLRPRLGSGDFEEACAAHAAADAHGDDYVLYAAAFSFDEGVAHHAGAAHAVGVADRDGAAVDVELVARDVEPVAAVDHLHCERLVQLPEADVVHLEAVALEELRDREDRTDAHLVG